MCCDKKKKKKKKETNSFDKISTNVTLLLLSSFSCVRLCATPQTAAHQAPPSLGFSRQEHWSGLPFPSPMHESEKWKGSCSVVSNFATPWTAAHQAPPSLGLSRQEYWSGVPLPSPNVTLRHNKWGWPAKYSKNYSRVQKDAEMKYLLWPHFSKLGEHWLHGIPEGQTHLSGLQWMFRGHKLWELPRTLFGIMK